MGFVVTRINQIRDTINAVPEEGRLFGFFAIDDRPSHKYFLEFLQSSARWLDQLAASSLIYTFMPASRWSESKNSPFQNMYRVSHHQMLTIEESEFLNTFEERECFSNPSLVLASKFGIKPRELPGIIIFQALPEHPPVAPFFIPLKSMLSEDAQRFEEMLAELFSRIQETWRGTSNIEEVVRQLRRSLPKIVSDFKRLRPVEKNLKSLFNESLDEAPIRYLPEDTSYPFLRHEERKGIRIFISYAKEDEPEAELLFHRFREAGFAPWMDKHSILPGEKWESAIRRAVKESDFFVACLSYNSVRKRGYVQREFRYGLDQWEERIESDIYLIPVRLNYCEIPEALSKFQWIDFYSFGSRSRSQEKTGWDRIIMAITEGVRRRQG